MYTDDGYQLAALEIYVRTYDLCHRVEVEDSSITV